MRKALLVVAAVALVVWVISWFRSEDAVAASAAQAWPGGRGTLDAVRDRFPALEANDASRRFMSLANALPRSEEVDAFVRREVVRAEQTIGVPPKLSDTTAIRDLLLREPIVWERRVAFDDGSDRRGTVMIVARALVASALTKARANDPAAWDDLRAVWNLARTLDGHPQMMLQTASLSMARMINAVAWKMPLPAPAWLAELQRRDDLQPLLEAFQYQTASYWESGSRIFPTKMLAQSVDRDRAIAERLVKVTACDVTTPMNDLGVDLSSVWQRVFRYRAEREATANALRVREGKPIETKSVCSDGAWSVNGATLRFSHDIPSSPSDNAMPLVIHIDR